MPEDDDGERPRDEIAEMAEGVRRSWSELTGRDGYLPVLGLLLAAALSGLVLGEFSWGPAVAAAFSGGALLATVYRSTDRRPVRRGTVLLAAAVLVLAVVDPDLTASGRVEAGWLSLVAQLTVVAAALPLVLVRALQHRRVTLNTVCATISAYLLIGIFFAVVYRLHQKVAPPFFAQVPDPTTGEFSYFSFMTLTTVGFGDFTPGSDPARAWVVAEAVLGQVFVITALARVVSLLGAERPR